jgi:hypothetical protein
MPKNAYKIKIFKYDGKVIEKNTNKHFSVLAVEAACDVCDDTVWKVELISNTTRKLKAIFYNQR